MRLRKQILCVVLASLFGLTGLGTAQVDDAPSLAGVIDIHAHVAPETSMLNFKRAFDAIEAAQIARIYGMRGIVLKEHYTETGSWAYLASQTVPGVEIFGGIVLNKAVGGMLRVIAKYDLGLSTGHVSAEEALMVVRAAKQAGVNKIYVQHPNHGGIVMSMAQMKEAVRLGALIEIVLSGEGLTGGGPKTINVENPVMDYGPQKIADIRALGPANIVISTDLGQPGRVNYAQAFQTALAVLAKSGFSQAEIDMMTRQNPARFLGLK
jgi:Family of unknown function (DUF6282)